jgi:hypothetical protein
MAALGGATHVKEKEGHRRPGRMVALGGATHVKKRRTSPWWHGRPWWRNLRKSSSRAI